VPRADLDERGIKEVVQAHKHNVGVASMMLRVMSTKIEFCKNKLWVSNIFLKKLLLLAMSY